MKKDTLQDPYARLYEIDRNIDALDEIIKGGEYILQRSYTEAIAVFDKIILEGGVKNSIYADALNGKALCLYMLNKFPEALEYTVKLLAIDPVKTKWGQAASCLYYMDRYEEALKYSEKGLAKDDADIICLLVKADCLYELSRYDEAIEYYDKLFKINHDASLLSSKAKCLMNMRRYEEANEMFDSSLKLGHKSIITLLQKIYCLCKLSEYEKVLIYCYEADLLAFEPQYKKLILKYRIIALTKLERYDEATACKNAIKALPMVGLDNLEVKDISHKIAILEQLGNS